MSIELFEIGYVESLTDFSHSQKKQMADWLASHHERHMLGIGIIRSCEAIVSRANQGSSLCMSEKIIKSLLDDRVPLDTRNGLEDRAAILLIDGGKKPCSLLDNHFSNYRDGSIMVGYEHTGFMIDRDTNSVVIHPETRFAIHLPEDSYDLSHGQDNPPRALIATGRTLFFYRLAQACKLVLDAALSSLEVIGKGEKG